MDSSEKRDSSANESRHPVLKGTEGPAYFSKVVSVVQKAQYWGREDLPLLAISSLSNR